MKTTFTTAFKQQVVDYMNTHTISETAKNFKLAKGTIYKWKHRAKAVYVKTKSPVAPAPGLADATNAYISHENNLLRRAVTRLTLENEMLRSPRT